MIFLEIRETRKYVGTYQHEDRWRVVGTGKVIAQGKTETDPEDETEGHSVTRFIEVTTESTDAEIKQALKDTFTMSGCHHEYDCCGCWSSRATKVEKLKDNLWMVVIAASRNF